MEGLLCSGQSFLIHSAILLTAITEPGCVFTCSADVKEEILCWELRLVSYCSWCATVNSFLGILKWYSTAAWNGTVLFFFRNSEVVQYCSLKFVARSCLWPGGLQHMLLQDSCSFCVNWCQSVSECLCELIVWIFVWTVWEFVICVFIIY